MLLNRRGGAVVQYQVRYQGGRKVFDKLEGNDPASCARAFAAEQRTKENGWAELSRLTTEIIERKR